MAVGEDKAPDISFFAELTDVLINENVATEPVHNPSGDSSAQPAEVHENSAVTWDDEDDFEGVAPSTSSTSVTATVNTSPLELQPSSAADTRPSTQLVDDYLLAMRRALVELGDGLTNEALIKATERVVALTTSNQLNSLLHSAGSRSELTSRGGAGRGKIRVQPTSISRRQEGQPRGAARLGKGRRPKDAANLPSKRRRCLAENVQANVANAKAHGPGH